MMGEEFYAIIKLVSGEEIFCLLYVDETGDDTILVLNKPIIITQVMSNGGHYLKVRPWMEITEEEIFFVKLDKVITMTESVDKKLISIYNKFISDESNTEFEDSGKVSISKNMGYVSSVEDARKYLEDVFNSN